MYGEPTVVVIPVPESDTLCNNEFTEIHLTNAFYTTNRWNSTMFHTQTSLQGDWILQWQQTDRDSLILSQLVNLSDTAQRIDTRSLLIFWATMEFKNAQDTNEQLKYG